MTLSAVKELVLEWGTNSESILYRLQKSNILRFTIGASLLGAKVRLFTNYPIKGEFNRETFYELKWEYSLESDRTSYYTEVTVSVPGSFIFYFTDSDALSPPPSSAVGNGFFIVDPALRIFDETIPLDSIVCQTVISKLLGPIDLWRNRLLPAKECGYNMVHFTPIQALGSSNSAYSITDQLDLNPAFSSFGTKATFEQVEEILNELREEHGILSICDIVLNHTANETVWLADHPSATYNLINSPHLRPAFLLDRAIAWMARDIGEGKLACEGIPEGVVDTAQQLEIARSLLSNTYIPKLRIEELVMVDVNQLVQQFSNRITTEAMSTGQVIGHLKIIQDEEYRRFGSTVDMDLALQIFNVAQSNVSSEQERREACIKAFRDYLEILNKAQKDELHIHLRVAVDNVIKGATYERLDPTGPKKYKCDYKNEFSTPYFTCPDNKTVDQEMELIYAPQGALCMAHNGWVMGDDPLRNFALPGSNVYLRRELVAWGDSVKLRFGEKPSDSPFLWKYMEEYTTTTARLFDGIRLDNCHSTPIHVASYMLDAARRIRPDLYVVAELFTSSEHKDNIFVNNLGITSLIREGLSAWDSHELGRLVYKYGGKPVGAFSSHSGYNTLHGEVAHALFLDWTHDNPSPVEKRTIEDMLPSAGLVSMASCAVGSNRGYDELVPHHIHVVTESRSYSDLQRLDLDSGMLKARRELSNLHIRLAVEGYTEVFVDQLTKDMVAVTRHSPRTRRSVIMVAHTRFNHMKWENNLNTDLVVEGELDQVLLEAKMVNTEPATEFLRHDIFINGCTDWRAEVRVGGSDMIKLIPKPEEGKLKVDLSCLVSGSFVVFSVKPVELHRLALEELEKLDENRMDKIISNLGLDDVQFALYQCDQEGRESGFGTYNFANFGKLNYCGLAGLVPILNKIAENNDLGHPIASNLRDGDWLMDYIVNRLLSRPGTKELGLWLKAGFSPVSRLPRYLIPRYFHSIVARVYEALDAHQFTLMSSFATGSSLIKSLARGTVIHLAAVPSALLPPLSDLLDPKPLVPPPTLAAGLPHFSTGYMRSWGRDTFISLRGLLLTTGQFTAARDIILGYASTLRHGLIPNLLDSGNNARFNCRDAVWWWLRAVLDYIEIKEDGEGILQDPVIRLFSSDCQEETREELIQPLQDVIAEALTKHWIGLKFREWNAGKKIDEHMVDEGFNNQIGVDRSTGFVYGGNTKNCGTWMDKMGSSEQAGNKGVPSTPRDGSAVEIVGLSYSCIKGLSQISAYPHQVVGKEGDSIRLVDWAHRIKENFEDYFWVGSKYGAKVEPHAELVNCVEMYKDSVRSGDQFTDYQLRPNFPIALAVAPDLVAPEHGWAALKTVMVRLLGPLGLATLDPEDWAYRGDYDNSNQSADPKVAHGANYHQGPEWVWPIGFFLRALVKIGARLGDVQLKEAKEVVFRVISKHYEHLEKSSWLGLPELTNSKGLFCRDSNPIQAWSHSTLLDTLYDLEMKKY